MKVSTDQVQDSKDKGIIQAVTYKDFIAVCDELKLVDKAIRELVRIADSGDNDTQVRVGIYKWIIEMNVGKPKQIEDKALPRENNVLSSTSNEKMERILFPYQCKDALDLIKNAGVVLSEDDSKRLNDHIEREKQRLLVAEQTTSTFN